MLIIVASLGYFVDIYDLVLFNVVKKESLEYINAVKNMGWTPDQLECTESIGGVLKSSSWKAAA